MTVNRSVCSIPNVQNALNVYLKYTTEKSPTNWEISDCRSNRVECQWLLFQLVVTLKLSCPKQSRNTFRVQNVIVKPLSVSFCSEHPALDVIMETQNYTHRFDYFIFNDFCFGKKYIFKVWLWVTIELLATFHIHVHVRSQDLLFTLVWQRQLLDHLGQGSGSNFYWSPEN